MSFSANLKLAEQNKVCTVCKSTFCSVDVCRQCYKTPEGKCAHTKLTLAKRRITCQEKYGEGITNPMHSTQVREKLKKTFRDKYGVDNPMFNAKVKKKHQVNTLAGHNTEEYKQKARDIRNAPGFMEKVIASTIKTNLERYGVTNPMLSTEGRRPYEKATKKWKTPKGRKKTGALSRDTIRQKYGVDNPFQADVVKTKIRETMLEKYGVEHALQDPKIKRRAMVAASKAKACVKTCKIKGRTFKYQGYEKPMLELCVDRYGVDNVISHGDVLPIPVNDITHTLPDIFIESTNTYIEVKSAWSLVSNKRTFYWLRERARHLHESKYHLRWALCSEKEVLAVFPYKWWDIPAKGFLRELCSRIPDRQQREIKKFVKNWKTHES